VVDHSEHRRVSETDVELLELGGPADEFPANFLFFFSCAISTISDSAKTSKKATDREQTKAPFPPIAIFTPRAPPPPTDQFMIST
jgi:hypothetical protein